MSLLERELGLVDWGRVVVRRKWLVLAALLTSLGASLLMSLLQDPIYEAESQMLVEPRSGQAVFEQDPTLNVQNLDRAIQTEIKVLEGQRVRSRVQSDLGLDHLPPTVDGTAVGATDVVSVKVRSKDPKAAQRLADAYVTAYTETRRDQAVDDLNAASTQLQDKVDQLQTQIDQADATQQAPLVAQQTTYKQRLGELQIEAALTTGGASVVKSAELPTDPVEPTALRSSAWAPPSSSTTSTTRCARRRTSRGSRTPRCSPSSPSSRRLTTGRSRSASRRSSPSRSTAGCARTSSSWASTSR
jgi:polysaccharide biosynthesis transport protein